MKESRACPTHDLLVVVTDKLELTSLVIPEREMVVVQVAKVEHAVL